MIASPTELSLNCKPNVYSMLSRSYEEHANATEQIQKLQEFVARLEEEKLKIDAFERELPLCMLLLSNVMDAFLEELQSQRKNQAAKLEEFIPLKLTKSSENEANLDKANWMTSAQLWHQEIEGTNPSGSPLLTSDPILALNSQQGINGREAFHPFSTKDIVSSSPGPELALAPSFEGMAEDCKDSLEANSRREKSGTCANSPVCGAANAIRAQRKARRSWSPDLHRRFVHALQMLGGSHVATPRQIRELMKVDGLTNDEVKSHLQKYRLHTRSPSPSRQGAVVVLGGIWVPPEYAATGEPASVLYGMRPTCTTDRVAAPLFSTAPLLPKQTYHVIAAPDNTGSWWKADNGGGNRC